MLRRQMTIFGSWTFSTVGQAQCAQFVADRNVQVEKIYTDRWRLDQAAEAYQRFDMGARGKGVFLL